MRFDRLTCPAFLVAWGLLFALGAAGRAQTGDDKSAVDRAVSDALKQLNDRARVLHNPPSNDANSCFRMFQGGLVVAKAMLAHRPDLQKEIDDGLAEAEKQPLTAGRNLTIHKVIEKVRTKLRAPSTGGPDLAAKDPQPVPAPPKTDPVPPPPKPDTPPTPPKAELVPSPLGPTPTPEPTAQTLWKKMGGTDKVKPMIDDFVALTVDDPKIDFTRGGKFKFDDAKTKDLKEKLLGYFSSLADGDVAYTGKSMADAHKGMTVTQTEMDAAIANLKLSAEKQGIAPAEVDEFLKRVKAKAKDFLPPPDEKKD